MQVMGPCDRQPWVAASVAAPGGWASREETDAGGGGPCVLKTKRTQPVTFPGELCFRGLLATGHSNKLRHSIIHLPKSSPLLGRNRPSPLRLCGRSRGFEHHPLLSAEGEMPLTEPLTSRRTLLTVFMLLNTNEGLRLSRNVFEGGKNILPIMCHPCFESFTDVK